ncbi:MAG: histidine kinase dimerization/phospho-acceptor domain-containing protein, partial [Gemmatimonadota bacterium]
MKLSDLIGVLGHELRTPLAAILGYQELLSDGLYGELSDRQREPVERIHQSAQQLLYLLDGLQELAEVGSIAHDEIVIGDTGEISRALLSRLQAFAQSRSVKLTGDDQTADALGAFRLQRFLRAAEIALVAAIKSSHGSTLRLHCTRENGAAVCSLYGCALDPAR